MLLSEETLFLSLFLLFLLLLWNNNNNNNNNYNIFFASFFTPILAGGPSMESSQYSSWSKQRYGLKGLSSSGSRFYQAFRDRWYQFHPSYSSFFFVFRASSKYFPVFSLSFLFTLWFPRMAKSTIPQVLFFLFVYSSSSSSSSVWPLTSHHTNHLSKRNKTCWAQVGK